MSQKRLSPYQKHYEHCRKHQKEYARPWTIAKMRARYLTPHRLGALRMWARRKEAQNG